MVPSSDDANSSMDPRKMTMMIPKDSICFLPQYLYFQDEDVFPDPSVFWPEQWNGSDSSRRKEMEQANSMTFSYGPQSCPGKPLAMEEIHQLLPQFLLHYSLHPEIENVGDETEQFDYCVILKRSNVRLVVKKLETATGTEDISESLSEQEMAIARRLYQFSPPATTSQGNANGSSCTGMSIIVLLLSILLGVMLLAPVFKHLDDGGSLPNSLKTAILTEPSPIGSCICGQSKRIKFLTEYLVNHTQDSVTLITADVYDKIRPAVWRDKVQVKYTFGMPLPSYKQISILLDWTSKALRELLRMQPDLIHVTTPGPLLFPSILASRLLRNTTLVMSCHTHLTAYAKTYLPPGINVVVDWILWRDTAIVHLFADVMLVTSPQIRDDFERHGIARVQVWQKGVDSEKFHPKFFSSEMRQRMTKDRSDKLLLVYIGRLAEEKRIVVLKGVLKKLPSATLCVIGAGPYGDSLREQFAGTDTIFLGESRGLELSQAFASGDVFLMPSTSETLGFVVLESMASGVPVVAADAGGLQHLIDNGRTGFLVTPEIATAFVERVQELVNSFSTKEGIIEGARMETKRWSWTQSMTQLKDEIYPRAMKRRLERF
ncbi:unnamed protein product [Cylindrotheca closterium]|uniref:Uncharacterized protein n=1 Tax=Cylindrotheca closterium TaxID=2856 RepID=A0AAD2CBW0_9STRA|nr:unnamed protein product [Cylindrotheca closterium]